jgi:hypothetical protein
MAAPSDFPHLPLILSRRGRAKLPRGGKQDRETVLNSTTHRSQHATQLGGQVDANLKTWQQRQAERAAAGLPVQPGIPLLLEIDPGLDLDKLRTALGFEIVSTYGDTLVPIADRWTRRWAAGEERAVKGALKAVAKVSGAERAPWFEMYAVKAADPHGRGE